MVSARIVLSPRGAGLGFLQTDVDVVDGHKCGIEPVMVAVVAMVAMVANRAPDGAEMLGVVAARISIV